MAILVVGNAKAHVGDKIEEIRVLFGHFRLDKMIRYSPGNVNHRITVNYSLEFRAQWRGMMEVQSDGLPWMVFKTMGIYIGWSKETLEMENGGALEEPWNNSSSQV